MPEWIWHWLGYGVALLAFVGVVWALFADRSRGRRRCRRCWYDMSGVGGGASDVPADCPECGRAHSKVRHLTRTRRRWVRAIALLLVMVVGGYGLWVVPRVQAEGAWGLAPTSLLFSLYSESEWRAGRELHVEQVTLPIALVERLIEQEKAQAAFHARKPVQLLKARSHTAFDRSVLKLVLWFRSEGSRDRVPVVVALNSLVDESSWGFGALTRPTQQGRASGVLKMVSEMAAAESSGLVWPPRSGWIPRIQVGDSAIYWASREQAEVLRFVVRQIESRQLPGQRWLSVDMSTGYEFENFIFTAELANEHPHWIGWIGVGDEVADGDRYAVNEGDGIAEVIAECSNPDYWKFYGGDWARYWVFGDRVLVFTPDENTRKLVRACIDALQLPLPALE